TVAWLAPPMSKKLISSMQIFLEMPHAMSLEDRGLQTLIFNSLHEVAFAAGGIFIVLAVAAAAGHIIQTGLFASLELIRPDFERLSWAKGIKRIFSMNALVELGKSFAKFIVLGTVVFFTLMPLINQVPVFTGHPLMEVIALLHKQTVHLITMMLLAFTVIA